MADPIAISYDTFGNSPAFDVSPLRLLDRPSLPMHIKITDGCVRSVVVLTSRKTPATRHMHILCNLYTRFKFGLEFNYAHLGGFRGRDFEAGNHHYYVGIHIEHFGPGCVPFPVNNADDFLSLVHERSLILPTDTPPFTKSYHGVNEVVSVWAFVMQTLLRHDWTNRPVFGERNLQSVYTDMIRILLNIMSYDELCAFLRTTRTT